MRSVILVLTALAIALPGMACGGGNRAVKTVAPGSETELSGKWNDSDAHATADALIKSAFSAGWLAVFKEEEDRRPALRVRAVVNKTDEHIDSQVFIKNIERAMVNSARVKVLAQEGAELGSVEREQDRSLSGRQSDESAVSIGQETGADFVMTVRVTSILDQVDGEHYKFYKINAELISPSTGEKAWIGDYEIKKHVKQKRVSW